ncbi:hypothetical protein AVEN_270429-1 [Araneus ventricosus]|uniref:Uncharacterized protein n=1 Tax=Araneus ventricosus TaxID=182803 RepID=A0A4Y2NKN2_ARAVE|nr:hypothetical protein AVEN_270429-1 [Araneus ventricosus]
MYEEVSKNFRDQLCCQEATLFIYLDALSPSKIAFLHPSIPSFLATSGMLPGSPHLEACEAPSAIRVGSPRWIYRRFTVMFFRSCSAHATQNTLHDSTHGSILAASCATSL